MDQIIFAIIAVLILYILLKSLSKVVVFIVVFAVLYFALKDSNFSFFGDGSWFDLLKKGQEIKTEAENKWNEAENKWNEWQTQQKWTPPLEAKPWTPPLEAKPSDDGNGCYSGKQIFASGNSVFWEEGMNTDIIPTEACYEGCKYKILADHEFKSDENGLIWRIGTWFSTGESCCPIGERWVESEQMCCEQGTVCLRITGNQAE